MEKIFRFLLKKNNIPEDSPVPTPVENIPDDQDEKIPSQVEVQDQEEVVPMLEEPHNTEPEESEEEQERDDQEDNDDLDERPEPQMEHNEDESQNTCDMFGDPDENNNEDEGEENQEGDIQSNQSFGRDHPKNHIEVSNQDQDVIDFKNSFDLKYESFKKSLVEKYQKIRIEYLKQLDFRIKENERENSSALDFMEQQLEETINEKDYAVRRASESRIILANVMREKYNTHYIKRACFQSWKYFYEWKKYKETKSKF